MKWFFRWERAVDTIWNALGEPLNRLFDNHGRIVDVALRTLILVLWVVLLSLIFLMIWMASGALTPHV
jgi:hypothetical protein